MCFKKRDINQLPKKVKIPQAQKINFVKELSDRFVANFFSHHSFALKWSIISSSEFGKPKKYSKSNFKNAVFVITS